MVNLHIMIFKNFCFYIPASDFSLDAFDAILLGGQIKYKAKNDSQNQCWKWIKVV